MSLHLLRGKDEALLGAAVGELVRQLVGDGDRSLVVDEFDGEDYDLSAVVAAADTPPFLTEHRVVVVRNLDRFTADEVRAVSEYAKDPLSSTELVLATTGTPPKHLLDALKASGTKAVDTDPPQRARDRRQWFDEQVALSGLRLDAQAGALLLDRYGEDVSRVASLLSTLDATFGPGRKLGADDVRPFLGEAGSVPPWELTDAIDRGDTESALTTLRRMVRAGERHPLQLMAVLHGHYGRMLRLDGAEVHSEKEAADVLASSPFQAKKAMEQVRRIGHDGVVRAFAILAKADSDVKGDSDLAGEVVLEIVVARLSRLGPGRATARR